MKWNHRKKYRNLQYVKPSIPKTLSVEKRVKEYRYLQSIGEKPKHLPRCKRDGCNKHLKIEEYVMGNVFCSDDCIEKFNRTTFEESMELDAFYGEPIVCPFCNKDLPLENLLNGKVFCNDICQKVHNFKTARLRQVELIKRGELEHPRCRMCNKKVPLYKVANRGKPTLCSEECHKQLVIYYNNPNNFIKYHRNCITCGEELITTYRDNVRCYQCKSGASNIGVDCTIVTEELAFALGILYNTGDFLGTHISCYSSLTVLERLRDILGSTAEIASIRSRMGTVDYEMDLISFPLLRCFYEYGLTINYLERDLPNISSKMLSSFYSGLIYSSDIFMDTEFIYYPMVNRIMSRYLGNYLNLPYVYKNGLWCVYRAHNMDISNPDIDSIYNRIIGGS